MNSSSHKSNSQRGFTIVELMIVVAIAAILVAIALPAYQEQVRETRRSDGKAFLMEIAAAQERYFTQNVAYGTLIQLGYANDNPESPEGFYNVRITASTGTTFTLTATPRVADSDCGNLTLTNTGLQGSSAGTPADCWD